MPKNVTKRRSEGYGEPRREFVVEKGLTMNCCRLLSSANGDVRQVKAYISKSYKDAPPPQERDYRHDIDPFLRKNNENLTDVHIFLDLFAAYACKAMYDIPVQPSPMFEMLQEEIQGANKLKIGNLHVKDGMVKLRKKEDRLSCQVPIVETLIYGHEIELLLCEKLNRDNPFMEVLQLDALSGGKESSGFLHKLRSMMTSDSKKERSVRLDSLKCDMDCYNAATFYCKDCMKYLCQDHNKAFHRTATHDINQIRQMQPPLEEAAAVRDIRSKARELNFDIKRVDEMKRNAREIAEILLREDPQSLKYRISKMVGKDFDPREFANIPNPHQAVRRNLQGVRINDDIVREALRLCEGNPDEAAKFIKERRQQAIECLKKRFRSISDEDAEQMGMRCCYDEKSMLILMSEKNLNAIEQQEIKDLRAMLSDADINEETRIQIAAQELFYQLPDRILRGRLLLEMLSFGDEGNRPDGEGWWDDFDNYTFDDFVTCVEDMNNPDDKDVLINCPMLNNQCEICTEHFHKNKIFEMECRCIYCLNCVIRNLKTAMGKGLEDALQCLNPCCPYKNSIDVMDEDAKKNAFVMKFQFLQQIGNTNPELKQTIDMFERNFRDYTMENMANFTHCAHCESGQVQGDPDVKRMTCHNCQKYTCHACKHPWFDEHETLTCVKYRDWLGKNHPEVLGLNEAAEPGSFIQCPNCNAVYQLQRGGCLHFTCKNCKHEFCGICTQTFHTPKNPCTSCSAERRGGLHAHHPRNCFYYLRDYDVQRLVELLEVSNVDWRLEIPDREPKDGKCTIKVTEEENGIEVECKRDLLATYNFCEKHMKEFLSFTIFEKHVDPVLKMDEHELKILAQRENVELDEDLSLEDMREVIARDCPIEEEEMDE